jgi:tetratricopeptide (TPR) repeat protein
VLVAGELLTRGEQQARAMALYDAALAESPDSDDLLFARAMLAEKLDRLDLLEHDLKAVLARDPDNATALNALGYTLADRTERYAEALDYIRRALELRPDDAAIIDSMGWVQYRLGNHELALNYLQDAYARNPDAEIAAHLGEVLWITGNRERARDVLRKAWEKDRENAVLKRVMQRFIP